MSDQDAATATEASGVAEVKEWLAKTFEAAGKPVPEFEYTPRSVSHLHHLLTLSKAKDEAARLVARDFRLKASEYRSQAARIREILENVGLAQESLPSNVVASAQVLANVANLLNIRDTELKHLPNWKMRVAPCEAQMESWNTNLQVMAAKERQYMQQCANFKAVLNHAGYTPEVSHGVLVEMAEHRKELEKKTKPILDTLRSYQDLPPDKALAALAIEDKKRQYAAAEKYLEDVLQSALANSG
ncbi:HAUS augmin-like complex subunit 1 [Sesbania bispinosa]|nr:HAUS augmin-like complex subunit 1 [Sesbania bispinosa]